MKTKSIFAFVLALVLAMSLSVTAFAAAGNETIKLGNKTIGVNGSYGGDSTAEDTYSVDVEWGAMTFTYTTTGEKTWDPETHTYSPNDTDKWVAEGDTVTVTNHSNVAVNVAFAFAKDESTYKGEYTGSMTVAEKQLAAGVENKPHEADKVESKLELTGTLNRVVDTSTQLGTITVTVSAVTVEP